MHRLSALAWATFGAVALAACTVPEQRQPAASPSSDLGCRTGPGGRRPQVTERGIGGTGGIAERGIGGTGRMAERGIGGTGIVGVITGFASVCLDGVEVAYDEKAPVLVDGARHSADALRAGQVAIMATERHSGVYRARWISVRHEVVGPVERVGPDGALLVAGQRVQPPRGRVDVPVGTWVAVSGLRDPEGIIHASRIDPAKPGLVTVAGPLTRRGGARLGGLRLRGGGKLPGEGTPVIASGALQRGVLMVRRLSVDPVLPERKALGRYLLQTYARREGGNLLLGPGLHARLGKGFQGPNTGQAVVLVLEVDPQGGLTATGQKEGGGAGSLDPQAQSLGPQPTGPRGPEIGLTLGPSASSSGSRASIGSGVSLGGLVGEQNTGGAGAGIGNGGGIGSGGKGGGSGGGNGGIGNGGIGNGGIGNGGGGSGAANGGGNNAGGNNAGGNGGGANGGGNGNGGNGGGKGGGNGGGVGNGIGGNSEGGGHGNGGGNGRGR